METSDWQPISQAERIESLDVLRGLALFGVLLVNMLSSFRHPLAVDILHLETSLAWADGVAEFLVATAVEFKAFTLLSFLFGVGIGVFTERASMRGANGNRFLLRRLTGLLVLGLCHLGLIWNGDILTLYAVCGFFVLPLIRLPTLSLVCLGCGILVGSFAFPLRFLWPGDAVVRELAEAASKIYSTGSFGEILAFQHREIRQLIGPLLAQCVPRTVGLMVLGLAAWRAGIFRATEQYKVFLWLVASGGLLAAFCLTEGDFVALALSYTAGILLMLQSRKIARLARPFAAVGQMALTTYLLQSIVLSLLFYGYGMRLMGISSVATVLLGIAIYTCQVLWSMHWLRTHHIGPVEWVWRSFTYRATNFTDDSPMSGQSMVNK